MSLQIFRETTAAEYWKSNAGIIERINMIGEDFTFRTYNNALAAYGSHVFSSMQWMGYPDACEKCAPYIGRTYRSGQYIPKLPKHPNCRCTWKLILKT